MFKIMMIESMLHVNYMQKLNLLPEIVPRKDIGLISGAVGSGCTI